MVLKVTSVVGARPQFIKAAAVSHAIRNCGGRIAETMIRTGQHYDAALSDVFFVELGLPAPGRNLEVGSGTHAEQTGAMLRGLEACLTESRPDLVLVYGDTNSTLAAALAAAKLVIPVAHIEAGLRSGNKDMPEEINRIAADTLSDLLFTGTDTARRNLEREGMGARACAVGDVMYDCVRLYRQFAPSPADLGRRFGIAPHNYVLATIHRAGNTDDAKRLAAIVAGLDLVVRDTGMKVLLPLHPRTVAALTRSGGASDSSSLRVVKPVSYFDMIALESCARLVVTDSGGVQKEAFFHGAPCVTVRDETEWVETVESGWNRLAAAEPNAILAASRTMLAFDRASPRPDFYGDGHAAEKIVAHLLEWREAARP
ncbi:MAG TPA: UDP-N-acetylglucosamine 2-epimerase (non-hydrolyzing) [Stellaceae bacterium]|nr:UDP-N-acetylglucosamine 2-epimerase (non-hydrolyzing) [Stellaceae bacterium]